MLDALDTLGRASVALVWLPVLAWSLLWAASEVLSRLDLRTHPLLRYRAAQALLFALPLGLALSPLLDPARFAPWLSEPIVVVAEAGRSLGASSLPAAATPEASPPVLTLGVILGLAVVALGLVGLVRLGRLAAQARALRQLRRALPPAECARLGTEAEGVGRVAVVETEAAAVPMTFGVWRPVIVLPASLSDESRRLALAHELVHVRRRDALAAWLEALVSAVFAAHPGVHRLAARCDLLREMACDATLLARPAVSRSAYAALVSAFAAPPGPSPLRAVVGMADSAPHVHQRLLAMTTPLPLLRRSTAALGWALAALVLVGASLAVTASRALAQERRVIIRTAEPSAPPVIYVDGVRHEGDLEAIGALDIHSVHVTTGEEARDRFGEDHVLEFVTRGEAEARGLPANEGTVTARVERHEADGEAPQGAFQLRHGRGGDSVNVIVRQRDPHARLHDVLRDGEETVEFYRLDGERIDLDRLDPGQFEAQFRDLHGVLRRVEDPSMDGPVVRLHEMEDVFARGVQSVEIKGDDGDRLVTLRLKDGRTEKIRLRGPINRVVRLSEIEPALEGLQLEDAPTVFDAVQATPNPASREVAVSFDLAEAADVRLRVYDLTGRLVHTVRRSAEAGPQSIPVDVSGLAPGGYVYRLDTSGSRTMSGRFTVTR